MINWNVETTPGFINPDKLLILKPKRMIDIVQTIDNIKNPFKRLIMVCKVQILLAKELGYPKEYIKNRKRLIKYLKDQL